MAHGLVDAVAVLQRCSVTVELLGQTVEIGEPPQQVLLTGLPELRIAHEALHQVQPQTHTHTHTYPQFSTYMCSKNQGEKITIDIYGSGPKRLKFKTYTQTNDQYLSDTSK